MLVEMALPFRGQTKTRDSSSERVYFGRPMHEDAMSLWLAPVPSAVAIPEALLIC
jgi:hypothetical protein